MKKVLPDSIVVLGQEISVVVTQLESDHGQYHEDPRKILIGDSVDNDVVSTLFHEACHAVMEITGVREVLGPKAEEAVVRAIENGMMPLIRSGVFNKEEGNAKRRSKKGSKKH